MKISIITVCYNSASTIRDTLKSVSSQTHPDIEYLIIDGASTDGTLNIIREYEGKVTKLISEPDKGIYDAMNKGIRLASGEIIGFINADDFYASNTVLEKVASVFSNENRDACYGDLCYVKQNDLSAVVRYWRSAHFVPRVFEKGWCPPHPTFFVRKNIYERFGYFDLNYTIAADVELMMRFLEKYKIRAQYIPQVLVKMRLGGASNRSFSNIRLQNRETLRALELHGLRVSLYRFWINKLISRSLQFVTRPQYPVG